LVQSNLRGWIFLRLYKRQSTCDLSLLVFHPAANTVSGDTGEPLPSPQGPAGLDPTRYELMQEREDSHKEPWTTV